MNLKLATLLSLTLGTSASAATITSNFSTSLIIPDNDPAGVADTRNITMPGANSITSLQVSLQISGGFNGDYYAYLRHGSTGFAVLLNRLGLGSANPFGYSDSGLDITLTDTAPNGDIHLYQSVLNPNSAPLTGQWQPDARNIDPSAVTDTTLRTTSLRTFTGLDPNGPWTLFLSDNSPLGLGTVLSWGLTITADTDLSTAVPDGGPTLALLLLGTATVFAPILTRRTPNRSA